MSIYYRHFFKCKDCGFMLSTLAQADREVPGDCPSCEIGSLDYAPKPAREQYAKDLIEELKYMQEKEVKS